jgi:hypothetical protein
MYLDANCAMVNFVLHYRVKAFFAEELRKGKIALHYLNIFAVA